ncbi:MAG: sulfocyanin-like copper-binding protein [Thermoplasmata archaeon]
MSSRATRRAAVAFILVVLIVGGSAGALVGTAPLRAAASVHVAATGAISVTADAGFLFTPNTFEMVPLNSTVTVKFTDADSIPHTFSILNRQGVVIPISTSDSGLLSLFGKYNATFNQTLTGSDQFIGTFQAPSSPGWYEFVCQEPGHFQAGMYGFIAFGENLPGNLSVNAASTDPGAAVFIIVGTIVSLVVIALVLGFYVGRRRGSEDEMAPQRLGYPEPSEEPPATETPLSREPKG